MMHGPINIRFRNAKQAKAIHEYKNIKRRLHKTIAAIWYNKTCKEKRLTPKYFTIKISDNSRQSINTQKAAIHYRINQEIKFLCLKKAKVNEQLYNNHLECAATWSRIWTSIQQIIDSNLQGEMDRHCENLKKNWTSYKNTIINTPSRQRTDTNKESTREPLTSSTSNSPKKSRIYWIKVCNTTCNRPARTTGLT